jgi:hypothetical protein
MRETDVAQQRPHLRLLPVTRLMVAATSSIVMYSPTTALHSVLDQVHTFPTNVTTAHKFTLAPCDWEPT